MPTGRNLGTVAAATTKADPVQPRHFVRIDFPAPLGIVRIHNVPWLARPTYSIALWDAAGVAESSAQTYTYYDVKILGIAEEERNPLEVTGIELANVGGANGTWGARYYTYGLRQFPIVISEVWWPTGAVMTAAHEGAFIRYIGTTDAAELDFVAGTVSLAPIPFRPAHDVTVGEEYDTAEWVQLPDPNTPVVWGPDGAHRLGVG
jgi:hypothetical protein